jgi:uncharacterized membrane protein HdeD (DUF308 family)
MVVFAWIALAVGIFCIVRGVMDLRARRYAWGALGIVAGLTLILMPIPTQAVNFDLPAQGQ